MKPTFSRVSATAVLLFSAWFANAADELVLQVNQQTGSAAGLTVVLDGTVTRTLDEAGLVYFDLSPGAHSVQIMDGDQTVHSFRFNSAEGQLADILVALAEGQDPVATVEAYFPSETAAQRARAATGRVEGRVRSAGSGVAQASVTLDGAITRTTVTDDAGRYELEVPRGLYTLTISHPDLGTRSVDDYRVIANAAKRSEFTLRSPEQRVSINVPQLEEVTVIASLPTGGLQDSERYATNVINTLDVEQLARFGDTDVAASVIRVPSVTVQDGQFVFIRGLGDRYVSSTLNGATMPSTNPAKRTVPLDLFPSSMVEQLDIRKSFIATMPGESTGGNLEINTRTFPNDASGKVSFQLGYVDGVTGKDAYVDPISGDFDVIGWDDGARQRPAIAYAVAEALRFSEFYNARVQQELGKLGAGAISDDFNFDEETATPDVSLGLSYGDVFDIDLWGGAELGYFAAANYKNERSVRKDGIRRTYGGVNASRVLDDFTFEQFDNDIDASGLFSVGLNLGQTSFTSNTIASRVTSESVRVEDGFDGDELVPSTGWSIEWEERQFLSQQLTGEHMLGSDEAWTLSWQGTASRAERYAPDRREVRFDLQGNDGVFNLQTAQLIRRYDDLVDDNLDVSVDAEYLFSNGNFESTLEFGVNAIKRERDSDSDTYGFQGGLLAVDDNAPNLRVSDVINDDTITGVNSTGFNFLDKTLPSDSYEAELDLNSIYLSYDLLWNLKYQLVAGVRYEEYSQTTDTFSLSGEQGAVQSVLEENSVLPSLSLNWFITDEQQLRFGVSKTVARPDFKETSNATFYDQEFNFRVIGNPALQVSDVTNYDVRWEKYWSDQESVSVALFYKDMQDPIERVVQPASGTAGNSRTFQNAESAEILGVEVDGRKDFALDATYSKSFFVALNGSYIDSEVTLLNGNKRELQGAPEYTFNLILGYDDIGAGHELTLLLNQSGDTIVDVGVSGQPDVLLEPRMDLNLVYRYSLSDTFTFRAKFENILDAEVEFTQGGNIFQRYKRGFEVKAGFDWVF
ncbi:TonB-dependent receptor [Kineobactrum sediminis]|uniref:TonB-dependent receptor n=1 Tax=Kineobactrum sediminis TaxID=1905677 RepID=A0A2N5Y2R1_9GAMM|nr:TonB-dependent receptor [Kineobactrum sediminis]PLW82649.1 TonB-dependent receptor [Kineobactrum sediminis]